MKVVQIHNHDSFNLEFAKIPGIEIYNLVNEKNGHKVWGGGSRPQPENVHALPYESLSDIDWSKYDLFIVHSLERYEFVKHLPINKVYVEHTLPYPLYNGDPHNQIIKDPYMKKIVFLSEEQVLSWKIKDIFQVEVIPSCINVDEYEEWQGGETTILTAVNELPKRNWCCFREGTRIPLFNGEIKNIEDITEEDCLFSKGKRVINQIIKRNYNGEVVNIDFGYGNIHSVTPEHPYITIHGEKKASELLVGDFIQIKFPDLETSIELIDYLEGKYTIVDDKIICQGNDSSDGTNKTILINNGFMNFIGWYLAEGSVSSNNIEFDLSVDEQDIADELLLYGKSIGVNGFIRPNSRGESIRVIFSSKPFAQYISKTFGSNSMNKKIPPMFLNRICTPLIRSLIDGDGSVSNKRVKFDSANKSLVESVFMFFAQFNIIGRISEYEREGFGVKSNLYTVTYSGDRVRKIKEILLGTVSTSGVQVKSIEKLNYIGFVYNFNVSEDHLYTTLYGTTHNCGYDIWEKCTMGMPRVLLGDGNNDVNKNVLYDQFKQYENFNLNAAGFKKQNEAKPFFIKSAVYFNTNLYSTLPFALMEAMAHGMPIVSTSRNTAALYLENETTQHKKKSAYMSNIPFELRSYLKNIISDPQKDEWREVGQNARNAAREFFAPQRFLDQWKSVLEEV